MNLARLVQGMNLVWLFSEVGLVVFTRRNRRSAAPRDRGSVVLLYGAIGFGIAAATMIQPVSAAQPWLLGVSLVLLVTGLVIRWTAILALGRLFTTNVAIHRDHQLVRSGPYRLVRHPSYTGLILLFIGMALSFGHGLSFVVIVVPFLAALLYRIHVEEASLVEALGRDYVEYCRTTKRLLPGLY